MPATLLWHANLKINTQERGFNFKFHLVGNDEAVVKTNATDIAVRIRKLLTVSSEIFFATISKDDTAKDSRFLKDSVGLGEYVSAGVAPPPSDYDWPGTSLLVRFEHAGGASVTRKFPVIPDEIIRGGFITDAIVPVTAVPAGAIAAPGAGADYKEEFTNLLKAFVKNTTHIRSGHPPGGDYVPLAWTAAFPLRVGQKKGGRVFI